MNQFFCEYIEMSDKMWRVFRGPPHPGAGAPLIQGLRTSSRGCVPHPGAAYLIQGRRIVIESSVNGLFLNKYEYVCAKGYTVVEYLCWISLV